MTFKHCGSGIRSILRQPDTSNRAVVDKLVSVKARLAFWLMAATDAHAKNFSIFRERGGGFYMTPLYDLLSAWPIMGRRRLKNSSMNWNDTRPEAKTPGALNSHP